MAGKRIPDLDPLSGAASANDDKLVIYDSSTTSTKRIDRSQLAAGLVGDLPYTPSGSISATTIPTAIAELDSEKTTLTAVLARLDDSDGASLVGVTGGGTVQGALNSIFPAVSGETGVVNKYYPVGDVRRYGVFPDGTTNWEVTFPTYITNIIANSVLPNIQVYWPPGVYNTSVNMSGTNGSKMYFDNAIFTGILHVISGCTNTSWLGKMSSYDRLGLQAATNCRFGHIVMLSDPARNSSAPGVGNRGVHILGSENISWDLIDVFDTGPTQTAAPGAQTIWAGFAIQSQEKKGFKGAVRIRDASGHGCYINALDVDLDIVVEGYGKSAINFAPGAFLEGTDSEAQSEQGCGVWLNRCTGRVSLSVEQKNASPLADVYSVLVDETGVSTVAASRHKPLQVDYLYATVGNGNRGVCVGESLAPSAVANAQFTGICDIRLRTSNTIASGFAGFNVNASNTTTDSYRRTKAGAISFHNFGTVTQFRAASATGTNVFTELDIETLETPFMTAGRFAQFDGTGGVLRGRVGFISVLYSAGSGALPVIDVDACENFHIQSGSIRSASPVNTRAIRYINNVDCLLAVPDIYNFGRGGEGSVGLETLTRCTIGPMRLDRASIAQEGVRFIGTFTDCGFRGINVTNFGVGLENGTGMTFTRCSAIDCVSTGNTDDTDITLAAFPAANQLNCTNWAT